ncbi:MAG: hypothetical protein GKR89_03895 [Candidatus Latescibacteria bacterium]|nr:hypothetical protein [Candidatus Latescibacterota bacterium]
MKKVCLVGCGRIGKMHADNLAGKVELSFYSRSPESARALQAEHAGSQVFEDFEQVLDAPVDAVLLASPPHVHAEQIIAGLAAGKSVLVEKPMCLTMAEVEEVGRAAEGAAGFLMVAENYYYKPSLALLKDWIGQGVVGDVQSVRVRKCFTQESADWRTEYGSLLEGGVHFIALVGGLLEREPVKVTAEFPGYTGAGAERHSLTRLDYGEDLTAQLHYAWNVPSWTKGALQHSRVVGDQGAIGFESNGLYAWARGKKKLLHWPGMKDLLGFAAMTRDFVACLEGGQRPYSDFAKARRDLGIVFAAYGGLEGG